MIMDDPERMSPYPTISTASSWIERAIGIAKPHMGFPRMPLESDGKLEAIL